MNVCFFDRFPSLFTGLRPGSIQGWARLRLGLGLALGFMVAGAWAAGLNDTGTFFCSDGSINTADCATVAADGGTHPRQDARYGADAAAAAGVRYKVGGGNAGFDFTALDAGGNATAPGSGATPHPCVRDNVTGLIWEVKTGDGGLRDKDWTYTWYNTSSPDGNAGSLGTDTCGGTLSAFANQCNTQNYVAAVNTAGLCGYNDWRMPTIKELEGISDLGRSNPAIDGTYFPNTVASPFWSGSPLASSQTHGWNVHLLYGVAGYALRSEGDRVRLVHGGS